MTMTLRRRTSAFTGISMAGKRFLDLCAGRGEAVRLAVRAGASYAEGLEGDEALVRAGTAFNAAYKIPNAVLRCVDLRRPGAVTADYDIGACFDNFQALGNALGELLSHVDDLFILQTGPFDAAWHSTYVDPVTTVLPYWALVGFTPPRSAAKTAAHGLLLFGRTLEDLGEPVNRRSEALDLEEENIHWLNVTATRRAMDSWGAASQTRELFTSLRNTFIATLTPTPSAVAALLAPALPTLIEASAADSSNAADFGTDHYWRYFFAGLIGFIAAGAMTVTNPYLVFLRDACARGEYDIGMRYQLDDEARAIERLGQRMSGFLHVLCERTLRRPLLVFNLLSAPALEAAGYRLGELEAHEHVEFTDGRRFRMQCIDGNHRLAALWLCGAEACPVLPVWTNMFGLDQSSYRVFEDATDQERLVPSLLTQTACEFAV